jgi:hypothetical protein
MYARFSSLPLIKHRLELKRRLGLSREEAPSRLSASKGKQGWRTTAPRYQPSPSWNAERPLGTDERHDC